ELHVAAVEVVIETLSGECGRTRAALVTRKVEDTSHGEVLIELDACAAAHGPAGLEISCSGFVEVGERGVAAAIREDDDRRPARCQSRSLCRSEGRNQNREQAHNGRTS